MQESLRRMEKRHYARYIYGSTMTAISVEESTGETVAERIWRRFVAS